MVLVAIAEIGDKTQLLSFLLAARLRRPLPVIAGILLATVLNHALAGAIGSLLAGWFPATALAWVVGLSFIAFGLWALRPDALGESPLWRESGAFVTAFVWFFLAEMGDKTQLATVALAARFDALTAVVIGTTIGMMLANVPAVWMGKKLADRIPVKAVRRLAATLFIFFGAASLWSVLRTAQ